MSLYLDKRVTTNGRPSQIHMDNWINIDPYVIQLIVGPGGPSTGPALTFQNGINYNAASGLIGLGGPLTDDTIIGGAGFDFSMTGLDVLTLGAVTEFNLVTPDLGSASNGYVLTLVNSATGESEWKPNALPAVYDAIVATDGTGDYLLPSAAFAAGHTSVIMRDGTYVETANVVMPSGGVLIGTSTGECKIILTGGLTITNTAPSFYSTGTISITVDTSTVTGVGTVFPAFVAGQFIQIGHEFYLIESRDSDTQLTLVDLYQGATRSTITYLMGDMTTSVQLSNFSALGTDGILINTAPLISLDGVLYAELENIFAKTSNINVIFMTRCGNASITKVIARDAGNAGAFGAGLNIQGTTIKISACNLSSNNYYGANLNGIGITIEASHINNNGNYGLYMAGTSTGTYTIDGCFIHGNAGRGVFSGANVDNVLISNTSIRYNGNIGIDLEGGSNVIDGNIISNNASSGVKVPDNTSLSGNQINNNAVTGMLVGSNCNIVGNTITGNQDGIMIEGDNTKVELNTITANTRDGIGIVGDDSVVSLNTVTGNLQDGIQISVSADNTKLINNTVTGNVTNDYNDLGSTNTRYSILHDTGTSNSTTIDASAVLDLQSTTQGILFPRMTGVQAEAITATDGLVIFAIAGTGVTIVSVGFWGYSGGVWTKLN